MGEDMKNNLILPAPRFGKTVGTGRPGFTTHQLRAPIVWQWRCRGPCAIGMGVVSSRT
jgi:hypothetical protein